MRIGYFIRNIGISGGVKVILQHVAMLRSEGYDVLLMARKVRTGWDGLPSAPHIVKNPTCRICRTATSTWDRFPAM